MIGRAPSLALIGDDFLGGGDLLVAILLAVTAVVAVSTIAAILGDNVVCQSRLSSAARSAAHDAARQSSPERAMLAAQRAAAETLTDLRRFGRPTILVDVSRFHSVGRVEVTVACTVAPRPIGPIGRALQHRLATASAAARPTPAPH